MAEALLERLGGGAELPALTSLGLGGNTFADKSRFEDAVMRFRERRCVLPRPTPLSTSQCRSRRSESPTTRVVWT